MKELEFLIIEKHLLNIINSPAIMKDKIVLNEKLSIIKKMITYENALTIKDNLYTLQEQYSNQLKRSTLRLLRQLDFYCSKVVDSHEALNIFLEKYEQINDPIMGAKIWKRLIGESKKFIPRDYDFIIKKVFSDCNSRNLPFLNMIYRLSIFLRQKRHTENQITAILNDLYTVSYEVLSKDKDIGELPYLSIFKHFWMHLIVYERTQFAEDLIKKRNCIGQNIPFYYFCPNQKALFHYYCDLTACFTKYEFTFKDLKKVHTTLLENQEKYVYHISQKHQEEGPKNILTIDPLGSPDRDDAISISKQSDGTYQLDLYITDVTTSMSQNYSYKEEAQYRGTSIYFRQFTIPMMPTCLANDACSLSEGVPRNVFHYQFLIKENKVLKFQILKKSIIVSKNLTYEQTDDLLQQPDSSPTSSTLQLLKEFVENELLQNNSEANSHRIVEKTAVFLNQTMAQFFLENGWPGIYTKMKSGQPYMKITSPIRRYQDVLHEYVLDCYYFSETKDTEKLNKDIEIYKKLVFEKEALSKRFEKVYRKRISYL
ncbi:MAG: RNB domain-containing ribonuclease [Bacilli bacterium]|nr:RNB domain-containing ribonuclease [Bacilli bacterium]